MAELALSDEEIRALECQPVLLTENFYPSTSEAERTMALPYGLLFQPFAPIDEKHKETKTQAELQTCPNCKAILNCFCALREGQVTCNFCGHTSKSQSLPASNIVDYEYECVNYQTPVLILAVDITYSKGVELINYLFQCGAMRSLLQVDGIRVAFVLFGTSATLVNAAGPRIELVTFIETDEEIFDLAEIPYTIPPFKETHDMLQHAFSETQFRAQINNMDKAFRNIKQAIAVSNLLLKRHDASMAVKYGGLALHLIAFGPDQNIMADRNMSDQVGGSQLNYDYLQAFEPTPDFAAYSFQKEINFTYKFYFQTNEFFDAANLLFFLDGQGSLQMFECENPSFKSKIVLDLAEFQNQLLSINIKFSSTAFALRAVHGSCQQLDADYLFAPMAHRRYLLGLQLQVASGKRRSNYIQLQAMATSLGRKTTRRVITLPIFTVDDQELLQGSVQPAVKLAFLYQVIAQNTKPEKQKETEKEYKFVGGVFDSRVMISEWASTILRRSKTKNVHALNMDQQHLIFGLFTIWETYLIQPFVNPDHRSLFIHLASSAPLQHIMRLISPQILLCEPGSAASFRPITCNYGALLTIVKNRSSVRLLTTNQSQTKILQFILQLAKDETLVNDSPQADLPAVLSPAQKRANILNDLAEESSGSQNILLMASVDRTDNRRSSVKDSSASEHGALAKEKTEVLSETSAAKPVIQYIVANHPDISEKSLVTQRVASDDGIIQQLFLSVGFYGWLAKQAKIL